MCLQPENEEKSVVYDNIGPNVCMGDHKVTTHLHCVWSCCGWSGEEWEGIYSQRHTLSSGKTLICINVLQLWDWSLISVALWSWHGQLLLTVLLHMCIVSFLIVASFNGNPSALGWPLYESLLHWLDMIQKRQWKVFWAHDLRTILLLHLFLAASTHNADTLISNHWGKRSSSKWQKFVKSSHRFFKTCTHEWIWWNNFLNSRSWPFHFSR